MAYASKAGRAHTSASNPRAFAVCDRCGIWYNQFKLIFQFEYAGASLVNRRLLVCPTCLDVPNEQLRAIILPADPVPISNPRPEAAIAGYTDYRATSEAATTRHGIPIPHGDVRITQAGDRRVTQQTGNRLSGAPRYASGGRPRITSDGRLRTVSQQRP